MQLLNAVLYLSLLAHARQHLIIQKNVFIYLKIFLFYLLVLLRPLEARHELELVKQLLLGVLLLGFGRGQFSRDRVEETLDKGEILGHVFPTFTLSASNEKILQIIQSSHISLYSS